MMRGFQVVGLVGLVFNIIGLSLPVAEVRSVLGFSGLFYGFSTDLVLGFVFSLIAFGLLMTRCRKWKPATIFLLSLVSLLIVGAVVNNVYTAVRESGGPGGGVYFSFGPGVFFAFIAPLTFMLAAWLMAKHMRGLSTPSP